VAPPRHPAFIISGQANSANLRPHGVNRAQCCDPNLADQRRAAIAVAPHAPLPRIHEGERNAIEIGVLLGGKSRPLL
jgi:hypothetical protein